MSDNFKCSKCGKDAYSYPIKGSNNTKLCDKCGGNTCFVCGKKETKKEWIEDVDCCGNKRMVEVERNMFGQSEKEENDPSEEIIVLYCDEHQEEAKKSPYLFTEAERVARREHKEKKYNEELAREKQEREERLNNQKNLFYCEGRTDENKDKLKYAAFLGKENGQKYYLMVPSDHLIWKTTDPVVKNSLNDIWHGGSVFFLVGGIENIPLEKTPLGYWKYLNNDEPNSFHKIVGLDDKITITAADNQENPEKDKPVENTPNSLLKEINNKTLLQYFQKNDIKSIKLENEVLIIEHNDNSISVKPLVSLKGIDKYLQNNNDKKITRRELELSNFSHDNSTKKPDNNLLIGCVIGGTLIIGVITVLLLSKKNRIKKS